MPRHWARTRSFARSEPRTATDTTFQYVVQRIDLEQPGDAVVGYWFPAETCDATMSHCTFAQL